MERTYGLIEVVGTSSVSIEDAVSSAVERTSKTTRHVDWFEVTQVRGYVRGGEIIGASSNFRFNDSPLSMLNRITASTVSARTLPREMADYAKNVAMPAVIVDGMNFTSMSDAR